jgi:hypothetical protein
MDKKLIEKSLKRMYELYYYALHDKVLETDLYEFEWLKELIRIEACCKDEEQKQLLMRWLENTYNKCDPRDKE